MKKITSLIIVLAMVLSLGTILTSCGGGGDDTNDPGTTPENSTATSYVNLDINPEISLTVNSDGIVLAAVGENEDAVVLLYGENGIVGENIETAVGRIVDLAVEMGYLTEDNKVVETLVSDASGNATELLNTIKAEVEEKATSHGISFVVDTEGAHSLLRRLEELKAEYPDDDKIAALTVADYKLALKASENGDITLAEAIELERAELVDRVGKASEKIEQYSTKAFKQARAAALAIYDRALAAAEAGVYTTYFTTNGKLTMIPNGALYQAYMSAATGFESIADALELLEDASEYELDEAEVAAIVEELGLGADAVEAMKNSDGKITIESVEDYVDVYCKNHKGSPELEELEDKLDDALDTFEDEMEANALNLAADYSDEIGTVINSLKGSVDSIRVYVAASELAAFDKAVTDVQAMIADGTITSDAIEDVADDLEDAAETVEEAILATLTEADLAKLDALKSNVTMGLATVRAQVEEALTKAESDAKTFIENLKNSRLEENK